MGIYWGVKHEIEILVEFRDAIYKGNGWMAIGIQTRKCLFFTLLSLFGNMKIC